MSPETKLKHLKDWVGLWIDSKVENELRFNMTWAFFNDFGVLINREPDIEGFDTPLPFEEYLKQGTLELNGSK